MKPKHWFVLSLLALVPVGVIGACDSETDNLINDTPTGTASGTGTAATGGGGMGFGGFNTGGSGATATGTGGYNTGGMPFPTEEADCQGHIYECGDLVDNDYDGLTDYQDPDCLGPCDNTEDSYYGGIPGQAGPPCKVDCYFDQDSGSGNDDCYWDHVCDPLSVAPNYYPEPWEGDRCEYTSGDVVIQPVAKTCDVLLNANGQSQECLDYCLPLTPNGCDCFGCCELPADSDEFVWLGSEGIDPDNQTVCSQAEITNPDICHPCTPVTDCMNDCGHCEICVGKPTLPPDCFPGDGGTPPDQCEPGVQPCGLPGQDPCPNGYYCLTGCCQEYPK